MGFQERYERVLADVAACCAQVGRDPREVRVVAVSKAADADALGRAIAAGVRDFGENRPDPLLERSARFPGQAWHFIGNIQSRRIPDIVRSSTLVHSLFQERHAAKFEAAAAEVGKVQDVLLEVNVSGEASKSGLAPEDVSAMLARCASLPHVRVRGLMTMAPQGDLAMARECFEGLARLRDELRSGLDGERAAQFNDLSMGMSEDWREAVAAGATIVRIGRALFDDSFGGDPRS
ncbi:YggS family pyridoxal phosphate enzyme [Gordonibacter sp. An230]|uniref:YggS family pyridoxal phosphate-dependent enzyme n=1 Tax=Gordonibacter sp. An230 TaxID=1965592 RepID=UPI000B37AB23|nr:YggS family pyridoxal phosphate-dependent enzyme [Gordonibacter sp. An230]OUO90077.1 YggS family pyridoxal phosphate enzyme [Gordonibacter sp. An230]